MAKRQSKEKGVEHVGGSDPCTEPGRDGGGVLRDITGSMSDDCGENYGVGKTFAMERHDHQEHSCHRWHDRRDNLRHGATTPGTRGDNSPPGLSLGSRRGTRGHESANRCHRGGVSGATCREESDGVSHSHSRATSDRDGGEVCRCASG